MSSTFRDQCTVFDTQDFREKMEQISAPFAQKFWRINHFYVGFHLFFALALGIELITFSLVFGSLLRSTVLAFFLAGIFLTIFTYLVLFFYFQARLPEKLADLRDNYLKEAYAAIPYDQNTYEFHGAITKAIFTFMESLRIKGAKSRWVRSSETLTFLLEKFQIWTGWKDLLRMKEMLLMASIKEHIRLIKQDPSDLEVHSLLASNYEGLSRLYRDCKTLVLNDQIHWTPPEFSSEKMRAKYANSLERALEEYNIIGGFAPNDPWVHAQRAEIFRQLQRLDEERAEYEKILEIDPQNDEVLMRLGRLYFRLGQTARGLEIYEQLKQESSEKASFLINSYDEYSLEEYSFD